MMIWDVVLNSDMVGLVFLIPTEKMMFDNSLSLHII